MSFFEFPNTRTYDADLGWVMKAMKELKEVVDTFVYTSTLKFADPITWNITTQYEKSTIVLDTSGNAYLSKQAVPSGIQLNNDDYWLEIFNFTNYTRTANQNLTVNVETNTTRATSAYEEDDWLIWNDVLYNVTSDIAIDDAFIVYPEDGYNIKHFTVEDFIKAWVTYATNLINQYKEDIDASELAYRQQLALDIANTTASLQAQLDAAIAGATVDSEVINARIGIDAFTYSTLGNAIRFQIGDMYTGLRDEYGFCYFTKGARISATSLPPNLNPQSDDDCEYIKISVNAGDKFYIDAWQGTSTYYAWAVYNEESGTFTRLARSQGSESTEIKELITIPEDGNLLVVNSRKDHLAHPYCIKKVVPTLSEFNTTKSDADYARELVTSLNEYCQPIDEWIDGYRVGMSAGVDPVINANSSAMYMELDVVPGEQYFIYNSRASSVGSVYYPWGMYYKDENDVWTRIAHARNIDYNYEIITIPDGVNKLFLNDGKSRVPNPICFKYVLSNTSNAGVHIRVGTYNAGNFHGAGYTPGSEEGAILMRKAIGDAEIDFLGLQFDEAYFNANDQITPRDSVFNQLQYYEQEGTSTYNYKALGGYYPVVNVQKIDYVGPFDYPVRHSYFLVGDLLVNGIPIKVATFHLDWSDKYTRRQQIAEIISYMSVYSYRIIVGDQNPNNYYEGVRVDDGLTDYESHELMLSEELPIWKNAGYKIASGGDFGEFITVRWWQSDPTKYDPCDNIFISDNLYYKNVKTITADYMRDHCILVADVATN